MKILVCLEISSEIKLKKFLADDQAMHAIFIIFHFLILTHCS